jgi:hypothetical protein
VCAIELTGIGMWADRILKSDFKENALKTGVTTEEELGRISEAWKRFITTKDAWYTVVNGAMICTKSPEGRELPPGDGE